MTATLAPGILPALVSRCFSIQDASADRRPSSTLGQPESNTRSNGTIRVISFRIKRLSTRRSELDCLPCQATTGRGSQVSGSIYLAQLKYQGYNSRLNTSARRKSRSTSTASHFGFTPSELRTLRALKTPAGVQKFLDDLPYNLSFTARSPQK